MVSSRNGQELARLGKPWAHDARGVTLPTRYTLTGTHLVQHVDIRNATFPVVADPWWSDAWKIAKCAAVLGANSLVAYRLIRGLREGLSIFEFAKLLVKGTYSSEKLMAVAGGITGISTVVSACKP